MLATYGLLFIAFAALYAPPIPIGNGRELPAWWLVFVVAVASGVIQGLIQWRAAFALGVLWACAELSVRELAGERRARWQAVCILLAVAVALHAVPDFPDPVVVQDLQLTRSSAVMTLRANFDKGAAGLLLLAYFSDRPRASEWPLLIGIGAGIGVATALVAIGFATAVGAIRFDPKWSEWALAWMPINLLLTCVFEEMLFRRLLQRSLAERLRQRPQLRWMPIALASALFGLAHAGGGPLLVIAATAAGVGYGLAYEHTRRVEAAIVAHFVLNATHFFLFTYPYAAR